MVFGTASKLDLKIQDSLELLQEEHPLKRVDLLTSFIDYKVNKLRTNRLSSKDYLPKL